MPLGKLFWAYLWGIETHLNAFSISLTRVSFEPTYEELKLGLLKPLFSFFIGFEPTYEELKRGTPKHQYMDMLAVLSLPMRNWNSKKIMKKGKPVVGFEPTYEELKHCMEGAGHSLRWVLSLPMRNWNMFWSPIASKSPLSFEPTYEELKLRYRDLSSFFMTKFWAYLWGIETREARKGFFLPKIVLSLPMRNWNLLP